SVLASAAALAPAGAARAQQAATPPAASTFPGAQQQQAAPQAPPPPPRAYYPGEPRPTASGQPVPAGGPQGQQRYDSQNPRLRFRPQPDPYAPDPNGPRPPTVYESASSPGSAARVQVDPTPRPRVAPPSQVEQLIQRSQETIDFFELVDDIMDEIARQLSRE